MDEIKENLGEKVCKELSVNGKKISRELEVFGIEEYDGNGNLIHLKYSNGQEKWNEYDDKGNKIHYKDSSGSEEWYEYDNKGKMIHSKDSDDREEWYEYDSNGNVIHSHYNGLDLWYEYTFGNNGKVKTKTVYRAI